MHVKILCESVNINFRNALHDGKFMWYNYLCNQCLIHIIRINKTCAEKCGRLSHAATGMAVTAMAIPLFVSIIKQLFTSTENLICSITNVQSAIPLKRTPLVGSIPFGKV